MLRVTELKVQRKHSHARVCAISSRRRGEHFESEFEMYGETQKRIFSSITECICTRICNFFERRAPSSFPSFFPALTALQRAKGTLYKVKRRYYMLPIMDSLKRRLQPVNQRSAGNESYRSLGTLRPSVTNTAFFPTPSLLHSLPRP